MFFLRYYLWIAPHLLCGATALIALRKKIHRWLPAFFTLLAFNFVELLLSLSIGFFFPQSVYTWFAVADVTALFLLELLVLFELAREVLMSSASLKRILQPLPRWTAAMLLLVAAALAALLPQTARERAMNLLGTLNFGLNLIAIGLLLAMLLSTRLLGISWRGIPAGIALGLGVVAATEMAASPLMAQIGKSGYVTFDIIRMIAFHICVLIWFIYILLPERPRSFSGTASQMSELEVRLQELQRMVRR